MYEVFYNLKAEPFRLSPDHRFCFEHKGYAKARAYMAYAFKRAEGFVMVTGRPGTGKTTLIGELVESLSRDRVFTANLVCTQLSADDLLKSVAYSFGIGSAKLDKAELLQRLTILFHRWHREGRRALLIVDEAQDLSPSAMEELRLLTNIQIGGQPLLQIFLLGQPELRDLILSPAMEQVHQRIVAASHIDELEAEETEAYVIHRLLAVGWNGDPAIDRAIFPLIHRYSEGVPRRINLICSRLFLLGSVEQRHAIELEDVRVVISELQAENLAAGTGFSPQDFQAGGPPVWVPIPLTVSPLRVDSQQQAAKNQAPVAAAEGPAGTTFGAKKKETPEVAPNSPDDLANNTIAPTAFNGDFESEPEYDHDAESKYHDGEWEPDSRWVDSNGAEEAIGASAGRATERRFSWRLGTVLLALVGGTILVVTLALSSYFSRQELQASSEYDSQPQVYVKHVGQISATSNSTSIADASSALPSTVPNDPKSPMSGSAMPAEALDFPPTVLESVVAQAPQGPTQEQSFAPQLQQDVAGRNESDETAVNSNVDTGTNLPRDAAVKPGQSERIFLVSFEFDSDDLLPDSHQALDSALDKLREEPDSLASITGFADSRGDEDYNLALSRKRASAVEQYLVDAGVQRQRLQVEGRGVLTSPLDEQHPGAADVMQPHRIVQIKLSSDITQ